MAPITWHLNTVAFEYSSLSAVFICLILAVAYVGSLYIRTDKSKGRDHPDTIKARFLRVGIVCASTVPFLWLCSVNSHAAKARILFTWIGIRFEGLILATILPMLLTMLLFAGPLYLHYLDGIFRIYKDPQYWLANLKNLIWVRNHIVAPLTEEFIFRACMLPLLVPTMGEVWAIFICPLAFGVAHFHHLIEKIRDGTPLKNAILQSVFQFSYTTVFGAYSAFLFLRTGHLVAPVVAHAFCNHMGFPNFQEIFSHKAPTKFIAMAAFVLGLAAWSYLLFPMTAPWIYSNDLYF